MTIGWAIAAGVLFVLLLVLALCRVSGKADDEMKEEPVFTVKVGGEETTIHPQTQTVANAYSYRDLLDLAKIMEAESGVNWPDWAVMCIGEVVLNRVAHEGFPDSVHEVLYQSDPIQYSPVWSDGWEDMEPSEDYIKLAHRLMDGERVFHNPDVIWQALFPQGDRTVMTYYDKALNTTTYFCE